MKWKVLSEELPPTFFISEESGNGSETLNVKHKGIPYAGRYIVEAGKVKNAFVIAGLDFFNPEHFSDIWWLDESPPAPVQEGKSAAQILKDKGIYQGFSSTYTWDGIIAAMEHYRNQSTGLREGEVAEFMDYLREARNEFVTKFTALFPDSQQRVIAEDLLIAFDQVRERYATQSTPLQPSGGRDKNISQQGEQC